MYTNISFLKEQLNIESGHTSDDSYLTTLLTIAEEAVDNFVNEGLSGYTGSTRPVTVIHATYLLAAQLYLQRSPVAFGNAVEVPLSFQFLLNPYRYYAIK